MSTALVIDISENGSDAVLKEFTRIATAGSAIGPSVSKSAAGATSALDSIKAKANSLNDTLGKFGLSALGIQNIAAGARMVGDAIGAVIGPSIQFQTEMSKIQAVTHASAADMKILHDTSLQLGMALDVGSVDANDAAEAIFELSKAGVTAQESADGAAKSALQLAAAAGPEFGIANSAALAADSMNAFDIAAKDMTNTTNTLVGAANASSVGLEDIKYSLAAVGPVAKQVGLSFEDTNLAIAEFGNHGLKGSDAGTSLKTMLTSLAAPTDTAAAEMQKLGLMTEEGKNQFFDASGSLKSYADVSQLLQNALKGMSAEQQTASLKVIFGSDAIRAAAIAAQEGATGAKSLAGEIAKQGDAAATAATMNDNLKGKWEAFQGTLQTAAITFGEKVIPTLEKVVDVANVLAGPTLTFATDHLGELGVALAVTVTPAVITFATTAIPMAVTAFTTLDLAAAPWIVTFAAIATAVIVLSTAFQNNFLGIKDIVQTVADAVGKATDWIGQKLEGLGYVLDLLGGKAEDNAQKMTDAYGTNWQKSFRDSTDNAIATVGDTADRMRLPDRFGATGAANAQSYNDSFQKVISSADLAKQFEDAQKDAEDKVKTLTSALGQLKIQFASTPDDNLRLQIADIATQLAAAQTMAETYGAAIGKGVGKNAADELRDSRPAFVAAGVSYEEYLFAFQSTAEQVGAASGKNFALELAGNIGTEAPNVNAVLKYLASNMDQYGSTVFALIGEKQGKLYGANLEAGIRLAQLKVADSLEASAKVLAGSLLGTLQPQLVAGLSSFAKGLRGAAIDAITADAPDWRKIGLLPDAKMPVDKPAGGSGGKKGKNASDTAKETVASANQVVDALKNIGTVSTTTGATLEQALGPAVAIFGEKFPAALAFAQTDFNALIAGYNAGTLSMSQVTSTVEADLTKIAQSSDISIAAMGQSALAEWKKQQDQISASGTKATEDVSKLWQTALGTADNVAREMAAPERNPGKIMGDLLSLAAQAGDAGWQEVASVSMGWFEQIKSGANVDFTAIATSLESAIAQMKNSSDPALAALAAQYDFTWKKMLADQQAAQEQMKESAVGGVEGIIKELSDPKRSLGKLAEDSLALAATASEAGWTDIANIATGTATDILNGTSVDFAATAKAYTDSLDAMYANADPALKALILQVRETVTGIGTEFAKLGQDAKEAAISSADTLVKAMLDPDRNPAAVQLDLMDLMTKATEAGYTDVAAKAQYWLDAMRRNGQVDYGLMASDLQVSFSNQIGMTDEFTKLKFDLVSREWTKEIDGQKSTLEILDGLLKQQQHNFRDLETFTQNNYGAPTSKDALTDYVREQNNAAKRTPNATRNEDLDFLLKLADPKTVMPSAERIKEFFAAQRMLLDMFAKESEALKQSAAPEIAKIADNVGQIFGGLKTALDVVMAIGGKEIQQITPKQVDQALWVVDASLNRFAQMMQQPQFQGDFQKRAEDFAGALDTIFGALSNAAGIGAVMGKDVDLSGLDKQMAAIGAAMSTALAAQFDPKTETSTAGTWVAGWTWMSDTYFRDTWSGHMLNDILIPTLTEQRLGIAGQAPGFNEAGKVLGGAIDDGMVQGLNDGQNKVTDAAKAVAKGAYDAAKAELESNSPSKKFMQLGYDSAAGYALGLDAGQPMVADAVVKTIAPEQAMDSIAGFADSTEYLLNRLQAIAKRWGGGGPKAIQAMGDSISAVVGGLSSELQLFKELANPQTQLPSYEKIGDYLDHVGQFFDMFRARGSTNKWKSDLTETMGKIATDIGGATNALLAPLDKLKDLADPKTTLPDNAAIGRYFSSLTDFVKGYEARVVAWSGTIGDDSAKLAANVGSTVSGLLAATDLTKLIGFVPPNEAAIDRYFDGLSRFLDAFEAKSADWAAYAKDDSAKIAGNIGSVFEGLAKGLDVLGGINSLGKVTDQKIGRALDSMGTVLTGLDTLSGQIGADRLAVLADYAGSMADVFGGLKSGLDVLGQINTTAIPSPQRLDAVFGALAAIYDRVSGPTETTNGATQTYAPAPAVVQIFIAEPGGGTHPSDQSELEQYGITYRLVTGKL